MDEKVWILISWLHQKPTDLDLQCFQKKAYGVPQAGISKLYSQLSLVSCETSKFCFSIIIKAIFTMYDSYVHCIYLYNWFCIRLTFD